MAGLCEGGNEPPGSLKVKDNSANANNPECYLENSCVLPAVASCDFNKASRITVILARTTGSQNCGQKCKFAP
ncbi:hypothetical protein ANN_08433 [Periplaneta americana]|uniref:Uncharacterized protein n=1 Tax=Periplaneta americana TaxID=6978 RepID=A0ABQ8T1E9_PERAM|nr:hypothetical protein ANN_08433 [Periplaneta americana]